MANTYTSRLSLAKPAVADRNWNTVLDGNADLLEASNPIGALNVQAKETPSSTLNVKISGGSWIKPDGTVGTYAGTASQAITASATWKVYLDASGTLQVAASYPTTPHVRLATVIAGSSTITTVQDDRIALCQMTPGATVTAYTQTYSTADRTISAYTSDPESSAYTGAGDSEAKLADLNALRVAYENLRVFTEDIGQALNAVIDDLQSRGILS